MKATALFLLCLLLPVGGSAAAQPAPEGTPLPGATVRDADFGVATRQFGLERQVEMYQWRASGTGYRRVWNSARIDSSQFAAAYQNPPAFPLESRRWWTDAATLDGKPIDPQVLRVLGTWQRFRPNFSRLPANLAAAFQPEGDGLGSSENPLAPQVGDLRVHWRELALPSVAGRLELRDGVWHLTSAAARAPASAQAMIELPATPEIPVRQAWPWLLTALTVVGACGWLVARRRRRRKNA